MVNLGFDLVGNKRLPLAFKPYQDKMNKRLDLTTANTLVIILHYFPM